MTKDLLPSAANQEIVEKSKDKLRLGEKLPAAYDDVLDLIKDQAPVEFLVQARFCAYCFWALDEGKTLVDNKRNELSELADLVRGVQETIQTLPNILGLFRDYSLSEEITDVFVPQKGSAIIGRRKLQAPNPYECLPSWAVRQQKPKTTESDPQRFKQLHDFYRHWTKRANVIERKSGGYPYHYYPKDECLPNAESEVDFFKAYIEKPHTFVQLTELFADLKKLKLHPNSSKLFEDHRLVLYWDNYLTKEIESKLRDIFQKYNVSFRGFSQDSPVVEINEEGEWEFDVSASGDQSRGEAGGGVRFGVPYDQKNFFKLYINQMLHYGRNPLDPYKISFLPVVVKGTRVQDEEKLRAELDKVRKRIPVFWYRGYLPSLNL